jgi:hypothetical protein
MATAAPVFAVQVRFNEKSVYDTAFLCENVAGALNDMTAVWTAFVPELRAAFGRNFDNRQGTVNGPWLPLDPKYLASKIRRGLSPRILVATGPMRAAAVNAGAPGQTVTIERQAMRFAINMGFAAKNGFNYAYVHDVSGVKSRRGRIVREFMVLDREAVTQGEHSLRNTVVRHINAAKGRYSGAL